MKVKEYIQKKISYLMLIVYVFGILKPLTPLAQDFIAHAFDKTHHMATVHFENGKYHVHKEMAVETATEQSKKPVSENFSSEELLASHIHSTHYLLNAWTTETAVVHTENNVRVPDIFPGTTTPPPEAEGLILL